MKKYLVVFKLSFVRELEYRFNFFLGRLRNIVALLLLFYVWRTLTDKSGSFASYTEQELITYIFAVNILRSVVFGSQNRQLASEINEGWFSKYLIQPVNIFWYHFFREMGQRAIYLFSAIFEVIVFVLILQVDVIIQTNFFILIPLVFIVVLSLMLYYLLSFLVSMIAFWSREAMGPRFLFEWFLEFASGAYFPLSVLSPVLFLSLTFLPFAYLIFFPVELYLGRINVQQFWLMVSTQVFWMLIVGVFSRFIWARGLKKYLGEGI